VENTPEGLEVIVYTHPEHSQAVEAQTDAGVVDDADIEVSRVRAEITLIKLSDGLQEEGGECQYRFDPDIFLKVKHQ
jgi:hypothetical protein